MSYRESDKSWPKFHGVAPSLLPLEGELQLSKYRSLFDGLENTTSCFFFLKKIVKVTIKWDHLFDFSFPDINNLILFILFLSFHLGYLSLNCPQHRIRYVLWRLWTLLMIKYLGSYMYQWHQEPGSYPIKIDIFTLLQLKRKSKFSFQLP